MYWRLRLNTVLTVISLIVMFTLVVMSIVSQYRSHGYLFNPLSYRFQFGKTKSQYRSHGYLFNLMNLRLNRKVKMSQYRSHGYLFNHFNFQQHQSSFQLFLLLQSSHDYLFNKHFSHFSQVYSFFITNEKKTTLFILKNTSKSINQSVFP